MKPSLLQAMIWAVALAACSSQPVSPKAKGYTVDLTSLASAGVMVEVHQTSRTQNLLPLPSIPIQGWSFVAMVPAFSITTFVVPL